MRSQGQFARFVSLHCCLNYVFSGLKFVWFKVLVDRYEKCHSRRPSILVLTVLGFLVSGCASSGKPGQVSLPVFPAWHEGETVYYITTDVSDQKMATKMQANYAPRLRDAVPPYPKPPKQKTVLERVYAFPDQEQSSVFASAPEPLGPDSQNTRYSPLWLMMTVKWTNPDKQRTLKSEGEIFEAEAKGDVVINRTNIVVNCPVVPGPSENFATDTDW